MVVLLWLLQTEKGCVCARVRGGGWVSCFSLVCCICTVCHGLFALHLDAIGRLFYMNVALPGRLLHVFCFWLDC